jgi:hypothetical protein
MEKTLPNSHFESISYWYFSSLQIFPPFLQILFNFIHLSLDGAVEVFPDKENIEKMALKSKSKVHYYKGIDGLWNIYDPISHIWVAQKEVFISYEF